MTRRVPVLTATVGIAAALLVSHTVAAAPTDRTQNLPAFSELSTIVGLIEDEYFRSTQRDATDYSAGGLATTLTAELHTRYASINTEPGAGLKFAVVLWDKDRLDHLPLSLLPYNYEPEYFLPPLCNQLPPPVECLYSGGAFAVTFPQRDSTTHTGVLMWAPKREPTYPQPQQLSNDLGDAVKLCLMEQFSASKLDLDDAARCVYLVMRTQGHPDGRAIVIGTSNDFRKKFWSLSQGHFFMHTTTLHDSKLRVVRDRPDDVVPLTLRCFFFPGLSEVPAVGEGSLP